MPLYTGRVNGYVRAPLKRTDLPSVPLWRWGRMGALAPPASRCVTSRLQCPYPSRPFPDDETVCHSGSHRFTACLIPRRCQRRARGEPRPEAGAQWTLEGVSSSAWFGPDAPPSPARTCPLAPPSASPPTGQPTVYWRCDALAAPAEDRHLQRVSGPPRAAWGRRGPGLLAGPPPALRVGPCLRSVATDGWTTGRPQTLAPRPCGTRASGGHGVAPQSARRRARAPPMGTGQVQGTLGAACRPATGHRTRPPPGPGHPHTARRAKPNYVRQHKQILANAVLPPSASGMI